MYDVDAGNEMANKASTHLLLKAFGAGNEMIEYVADRPGRDRRYSGDTARIRAPGWKPALDHEDALAETIDRHCEREDWWRH